MEWCVSKGMRVRRPRVSTRGLANASESMQETPRFHTGLNRPRVSTRDLANASEEKEDRSLGNRK